MATQVQFAEEHLLSTKPLKVPSVRLQLTPRKSSCVVHDAVTTGGFPLLREDGTNSSFALGSLTSCALKFASDANTGIISPGPDQLSLVTGGVARLTIDSAGAVTIPGNVSIAGDLNVTGAQNSNIALIVALG